MPPKNNVTRLLDARGIAYTAHELPEIKLGALEAAQHLGVHPNLVYKTIVAIVPEGSKAILAVVPAANTVNLKTLAKVAAAKKVKLATQREAEKLTGLQTGGISALALLNRRLAVILDAAANDLDEFFVSGGQRGLNLKLAVQDFIALTGARVAPISNS